MPSVDSVNFENPNMISLNMTGHSSVKGVSDIS